MTVEDDDIYPAEYVEANKAQATALKDMASQHGLRLETYFVPSVAEWVLTQIEKGRFLDPSEAVFAAMQVFMEIEAYPDLREELFRREIRKRLEDKSPGIPAEEVFARLEEQMKQMREHEPPTWVKLRPKDA